MPYAILLVSKLPNVGVATTATQHNYRTQDTPNADPQLASANVEYLNHERRNYWHLASERIEELRLPRLRTDAVRAVELVLTASPEAFPRGADHRAADLRDSAWVSDNLAFVHQRFGAKNVLGFALHQDEITPHIHCVVVPVTPDGRLSCRDVFSPASLRQLQTDYAKAMELHGLARGIHYSTARHEDVRRHYGAQQMSREQLAETAKPLTAIAYRIRSRHESLSEEDYRGIEQMRLDKHWAALTTTCNQKLAQLATVASANALEHERARVLEKQLAHSQELLAKKSADLTATTADLTKQVQQARQEVAQQQARIAALQQAHQTAVVRHSQGQPLPEAQQQQVAQLRERHRHLIEQTLTKCLLTPLTGTDDLKPDLEATGKGYQLRVVAPKQLQIRSKYDGTIFADTELQPNGQPFREQYLVAWQRTQQHDRPAPARDAGDIEL